MDASDIIALVSLIVAGIAFVVGLAQYTKAQAWKRAEFVASEIKEAFSDPAVRFALHLVDWNESLHDMRERLGDERLKIVPISDINLAAALVPHPERPSGYNPVEVQIRLAFDELLGRLQRFGHFIESKLVRHEDFHPYLRYWLELLAILSEHGKPTAVLHGIWRYIDFYRYHDVQRFFKRYGYDISRFPEYPAHLSGIETPAVQFLNPASTAHYIERGGFGSTAHGRSAGG